MNPVRWGILSTAAINDHLLRGASTSAVGEVVAVASRDGDRAATYAADRGIPHAYASYEALLDDPEVEAIYLSLPNHLHVEWTRRALEAGKHVLCEKPMTRWPDEVEALFDLAEERRLVLMEAFMYRHHPQIALARDLVHRGAVGPLQLIRSAFTVDIPDPDNIRLQADLDGGALMDVGAYCVSSARYLAGEPQRVLAERVDGGRGVDVRLVGVLRFAGNVIAHFDCGLDGALRDAIEIVGRDGVILLDDPWRCRSSAIELRRANDTHRIDVPRADPYRLEFENFSLAARGEAAPLLDRADAVGQARAIEALYQAAERHSAVEPGAVAYR